jgi:hypothetical protein
MRWTLMRRPYLEAQVEKRVTLAAGDSLPLRQVEGAPRLSLRCLGANQKFIPPPAGAPQNPLTGTVPPKAADPTDNANSVVLLLEYGGFRFFDGGDLTWNAEERLVCPVNRVGTVDLYQVNHHGLDVSNNPVLVRSLAPTVSVMNNGPRKGTSASAMEALRSTPSLQAMYQVHENLREDGQNTPDKSMIANQGAPVAAMKDGVPSDPAAGCQAHPIRCTVAVDAGSYTIEVPSTGHRRTYQTRKH